MASQYLSQGLSYRPPASQPGGYDAGSSSSSSGVNGQQPGMNFFTGGNISPEMLNIGLSAGQASIDRVLYTVRPGAFTFWHSLKSYFAVNNSYVVRKLYLIMNPFSQTIWTRIAEEDMSNSAPQPGSDSHKWELPKSDINAPDLYIPLMSFITYVLLVGYCKGASNKFTPEVLIQAVWRCLLLQLVECGALKFGLNLMQQHVLFLDIFSYTGYKNVGLCLSLLTLLLGSTIYFISCLGLAVCFAFFILKTLAGRVPLTATGGPLPRHIMILVFAGIELAVFCLLALF